MLKSKFKFIILFALLSFSTASEALNLLEDYDVIVAGGGTGGISAAIQAARMGVNVLVVEPTEFLGGQATAAGVSQMDDLSGQESGLYHELMNNVEEYYSARGKSIFTPYWEIPNRGFEPHIGHKILMNMAKGEDAPDILFNSEIIAVNTEKIISSNENGLNEISRINSVIIKTPEGKKNITCKILIDATEYGDIIPMTGAEYRVGNSVSPSINPKAMIQDITWTAIIRKYPEGVPEHLKPKNPLPGYDQAKWNYENYVTKNGSDFKGVYPVELPVNFVTHNAYRALPDSFLPGNYDADKLNWHLITKTGANWGNDYPGQYKWRNKYGLPAAYIEDKNLRKRIERDALIKTLHFIYYIQNELSENWSVDENEYNKLPEAAQDLPEEWKNIARHFPPVPYVRECRRIIGEHVLTSEELYNNSLSYKNGNKNLEISDAIAIGCYILDLHHSDDGNDMEKDLGEKAEYIHSHSPKGNFQVPLSILIPKNVDGFIVAEKNLSMSRLVASALRLQPITMMTGQAAGALAALSVIDEINPSEIKAVKVQKALLDSEVDLSLCMYSDVPKRHKYYKAIQLSNLYKLIEPSEYPAKNSDNITYVNEDAKIQGRFGVDEILTGTEAQEISEKFEKDFNVHVEINEGLTKGEAAEILMKAMLK